MTNQNNSVRKAEATPSIRKRAERLRDAAGRFIRRKPIELNPASEADPFDGWRCPPGFVRYPFEKPAALANIARIVIPNEAQRLKMARDEALRRLDLLPDNMTDTERATRYRQIRDLLRMDALEALAGEILQPDGVVNADLARGVIQEGVPTALGLACDWAIGHVEWINAASRAENWSDARLDEEAEKSDAVW